MWFKSKGERHTSSSPPHTLLARKRYRVHSPQKLTFHVPEREEYGMLVVASNIYQSAGLGWRWVAREDIRRGESVKR